MNFQMFKLVLEKAEEPEIKLPTSTGSSKKQESYRKTFISTILSSTSLILSSASIILLFVPSRVFLISFNFLMFKLVLEKVEEPEIKLPTSAELSKKQESSRKISISALLTMPKP